MPEPAQLVAAADTLAEASLYNEAISTYSKAIELNPTAPTYYLKRSTAYQRSNNLAEALKDAEQAVVLAEQRGKADLIAAAQFRKGISLNGLKRYADSNNAFALAKKFGSKEKSMDIWKSKNDRELAKAAKDESTVIGDLASNTPAAATGEKNKPPGPEAPNLAGLVSNVVRQETQQTPDPARESAPPPARVRHEWYQTEQNVIVDIFYKNIPKDKCTVEFESNAFTVSFPLSGGSDFSFSIDPLSQDIDPSTSTYEILSTKISLKLVKATRGLKWLGLEGTSSDSKAIIPTKTDPAAPSKGIAYPTSSRKGVKDWDAIEREIVKEAETWEKPEGDAAANALFRDLFNSASPEMRMAMEKSYVESNGTALSTNWDEVRKGRVETHPPDSMVAKKWGA